MTRQMVTEIEINSANWPVNIVRVHGVPGLPVERAATERFCAALASFAACKKPYANIIDLTLCGSVSSSERRFVAESMNQHIEEYRKYVVAGAVVVSSSTMRGVLTALGWIRPYPVPTGFVTSIAEGEQFLSPLLAARGIQWAGLRPADRIANAARHA